MVAVLDPQLRRPLDLTVFPLLRQPLIRDVIPIFQEADSQTSRNSGRGRRIFFDGQKLPSAGLLLAVPQSRYALRQLAFFPSVLRNAAASSMGETSTL